MDATETATTAEVATTTETVVPVVKTETAKPRAKRVAAPIDTLDEMTGELSRPIPETFSGAVQVNY